MAEGARPSGEPERRRRGRLRPVAEPDPGALFREIYEVDGWLGGSGLGSVPDATVTYRRVLQRILDATDVSSVVDAGCGDWQISRLLDWSTVSYLGVDVVPELVERNTAAYGGTNVRFRTVDLSRFELPRADLLVCKDVLQHWPLGWVSAFLARAAGRYRYALVTNDVESTDCAPELLNSEIGLGLWRVLDVQRPPFGLKAAWSLDYDVDGRWTKRMALAVRPAYRPVAACRRGSALRRVAGLPL